MHDSMQLLVINYPGRVETASALGRSGMDAGGGLRAGLSKIFREIMLRVALAQEQERSLRPKAVELRIAVMAAREALYTARNWQGSARKLTKRKNNSFLPGEIIDVHRLRSFII